MIRLQILAKELARELISILSITYNISLDLLLAAMRDQTSLNTAALRTVKVVYPKTLAASLTNWTVCMENSFALHTLQSISVLGLAFLHTVERLD